MPHEATGAIPAPPVGPSSPTPRKWRGCLLYGCLPLLLLAILIPILLYFYASNRLNGFIRDYTASAPLQFEELNVTLPETAAVEARIKALADSLASGRPVAPVVLNSRDLNGLLHRNAWLYNKVRLQVESGRILARISMPLEMMPIPLFRNRLRGRFLNGNVAIATEIRDGKLQLAVQSAELNGKQAPAFLKGQLEAAFSNSTIASGGKTEALLPHLESISLAPDRATLQPKNKPTPAKP